MEFITVKMPKSIYEDLFDLHEFFEVKIIEEKDDLFKDDDNHKTLKKQSEKAYKELKEYEFRKRHNIKK